MNKYLFAILLLVGSTQASEGEVCSCTSGITNITSINWSPSSPLIAVCSSVDFLKQLGPNSFVRAFCDKRTQSDKTDQTCGSCSAVLEYILSQKSKRTQKKDECLHAVYKLGLQAGRSDKEIEAEQERVLSSRPAITILERSDSGNLEEL